MQEVKKSAEITDSSDRVNVKELTRIGPSLFMRYIAKMKGYKRTTPLVSPPPLDIIISSLGAFLGIVTIVLLSQQFELPVMAAFGASVILVFGVPDAPMAQPRNVIFGHTLSAATGVAIFMMFGLSWWSPAVATGLALVVMLLTKTTHPPGGATALFAVLSEAHPSYILSPMMLGSIILVIIGLLVNNLSPNRHYPRYWI